MCVGLGSGQEGSIEIGGVPESTQTVKVTVLCLKNN